MQALAQPPDHLNTPHTGIVHQIPEGNPCSIAATEVESFSTFSDANKPE
jgi:hypothetical protein